MKPRALICKRPDMVANICAWCPDKKAADELALAGGYELNHTICEPCAAKIKADLPKPDLNVISLNLRPITDEDLIALQSWLAQNSKSPGVP